MQRKGRCQTYGEAFHQTTSFIIPCNRGCSTSQRASTTIRNAPEHVIQSPCECIQPLKARQDEWIRPSTCRLQRFKARLQRCLSRQAKCTYLPKKATRPSQFPTAKIQSVQRCIVLKVSQLSNSLRKPHRSQTTP